MFKVFILSPLYQGLFIAGLMIIGFILSRVLNRPVNGWNAAAILILLYCTINAIAGIFSKSIGVYFLISIGVYIALFIITLIFAPLLTGKSYSGYGENAMIFLAPVMYYPFLLIVMGIIRLIRNLIL